MRATYLKGAEAVDRDALVLLVQHGHFVAHHVDGELVDALALVCDSTDCVQQLQIEQVHARQCTDKQTCVLAAAGHEAQLRDGSAHAELVRHLGHLGAVEQLLLVECVVQAEQLELVGAHREPLAVRCQGRAVDAARAADVHGEQ